MNKRKKSKLWWIVGTLLLITVAIVLVVILRPVNSGFQVAVVSIVEIQPIAQLRQGFQETFEQSAFAKAHQVKFTQYNAQGDASLSNQIADQVATQRPDLVYVLGTPIAQAIQKRAPQILMVQGAVTDPVAAGLADAWTGSGRKYVATSDLPPVDKALKLIQELTPNVKRLGIIYNPSEANSVAVVSRLRDYIKSNNLNMQLVERPIATTADVATATQTLVGSADAIFLPPDNTAHAALAVIGKFAVDNKIPLYATVSDAIQAGALATLALDYVELGRESARLALAVLGGNNPATIPISLNANPAITINGKIATDLGIDLSPFRGRPNVTITQ
jgi:putative ABC transport system substrate-binding protein